MVEADSRHCVLKNCLYWRKTTTNHIYKSYENPLKNLKQNVLKAKQLPVAKTLSKTLRWSKRLYYFNFCAAR